MISSDGINNTPDYLEDLLAAHADGLVEDLSVPELTGFGMTLQQAEEASELMLMAHMLQNTLVPVMPSPEFAFRLKSELVGNQPLTLGVRWRKLPAHYQLAAKLGGLTITTGIVLLAIRRGLEIIGVVRPRKQPEADNMSLHTAS